MRCAGPLRHGRYLTLKDIQILPNGSVNTQQEPAFCGDPPTGSPQGGCPGVSVTPNSPPRMREGKSLAFRFGRGPRRYRITRFEDARGSTGHRTGASPPITRPLAWKDNGRSAGRRALHDRFVSMHANFVNLYMLV